MFSVTRSRVDLATSALKEVNLLTSSLNPLSTFTASSFHFLLATLSSNVEGAKNRNLPCSQKSLGKVTRSLMTDTTFSAFSFGHVIFSRLNDSNKYSARMSFGFARRYC